MGYSAAQRVHPEASEQQQIVTSDNGTISCQNARQLFRAPERACPPSGSCLSNAAGVIQLPRLFTSTSADVLQHQF